MILGLVADRLALQLGSTCSSPAEGHSTLNNDISFGLVQSLFCLNPQIHGSEPSPKKS